MPDQNDIIFTQYTIDFRALIEAVLRFFGQNTVTLDAILAFMQTLWGIFVVLSLLTALTLFFGFIYASIRYGQLADAEMEDLKEQEKLYQQLFGQVNEHSQLADIDAHMATDNPNDWKLAIIEADIVLDKILNQAGYVGASIGEKLKTVSPHSMKTLDDAWEAHKVRNRIAHDGSDFVLTKKIAQQTITQYKRVFAEFNIS